MKGDNWNKWGTGEILYINCTTKVQKTINFCTFVVQLMYICI